MATSTAQGQERYAGAGRLTVIGNRPARFAGVGFGGSGSLADGSTLLETAGENLNATGAFAALAGGEAAATVVFAGTGNLVGVIKEEQEMAATLNSQVIQDANEIMSLLANLATLQAQIDALSAHYTSLNAATILAALPTCVFAADGTLGTADVAPNTGHPIDTRVAVSAGLNRAVTSFVLGSGLTILQQVSALLTGGVPSQQASAKDIIAQCTGG